MTDELIEEPRIKKGKKKPYIARFFERAMVENHYDEKNFVWKNGEYECPIIRAMFMGYQIAQKDILNHNSGHFIIGKVEDSKPTLSNKPKIHHKYGLAVAEVNRLIEAEKDVKFIIYNSVLIRQSYSDSVTGEVKSS